MLIPPHLRAAILARWPVARLATHGKDGGLFQVPLVFAQQGDFLWSPVDGKPKRGTSLSRLDYVRSNPRASLLLDHYDADWTALWWVRIEARAEVVALEDDRREPVERALRAKYTQYATTPVFLGQPTALAFRIESTRSWCADDTRLELPQLR